MKANTSEMLISNNTVINSNNDSISTNDDLYTEIFVHHTFKAFKHDVCGTVTELDSNTGKNVYQYTTLVCKTCNFHVPFDKLQLIAV